MTKCYDSRRSSWRVLGQHDFRLFFAGTLASNTGTWLQNTGQVLLAYHLTHSVFAVGVVACAQFAGFLLLGPWAAVVAGHYGARRVLVSTQIFSAVLAGLLAWLEFAGLLGETALICGALGLGLCFTFALPVQTAMSASLVPVDDVRPAMAMNSVSYNIGRAAAPVLSVVVIAAFGYGWVFALNAFSFLLFAGLLTRVHLRDSVRLAPRAKVRDSISVLFTQRRTLLLLAMVASVTIADDPVLVLGPVLAHRVASNDWAGYFISALGCGTVLGALVPTRRLPADPRVVSKWAARSLLLLAGTIVLFSAGLNSWLSLAAAFLAGACGLLTGAATQTLLVQQKAKSPASVMALWAIAWAGTKPLASLVDGALASSGHLWLAGVVMAAPAALLATFELRMREPTKAQIKLRARRWAEGHAQRSIPQEVPAQQAVAPVA